MTYLYAYLFTRVDTLNAILGFGTFLLLFVTIAIFMFTNSENYKQNTTDEEKQTGDIVLKWLFVTFLIFAFLVIIIPSQKEIAFIYIAPKLINNVDLQNVIKQIPEVANLGLGYLVDILKQQ